MSVERNIEGVVLIKSFLVESTRAEVECHLGRTRERARARERERERASERESVREKAQLRSSNLTQASHILLELLPSSYLHGSGTHVREDLFSGPGILVITNSCTEALLRVAKSGKQ